MKKILSIYKPLGSTPLEAINRLKGTNPQYTDMKIGYAGRLDPQAEGLLLLLLGDENKNKHQYEQLPKVYEFDLLCGIKTDTFDIMGIPEKESTILNPSEIEMKLRHHIQKMIGTFEMTYPPYSAARVNGKPLYYWARKNKLAEIVLPTKQIHITEFDLLKSFTLHSSELMTAIRNRILNVQGDFRQEKIIDAWSILLHPDAIFPVYTMSIHCSSGAYVRAIAEHLGAQLGCGAIAYTIKRTQIGPYKLNDAVLIL